MPKVSVVMPVYNTEKYLRASLDSILGQTLLDIEVICVDDSSTDGSLSILREYEKRDNRVKVLTEENSGAGAARNNGLKNATGKYLYFFDSDDLCDKHLLLETVEQAEKTNADMVAFDYDKFYEDGTILEFQGVYPEWLDNETRERAVFNYKDCPDLILTIVNVTPWNKIYKTDFVKNGGFKFDEISSTNDIAFSAVTTAAADRISFISKRFVHYRVGHSNTISSSKMEKLHNVSFAVGSAISQIEKLPHAKEIEKGVIDFEIGNYLFAWQKIITDFSNPNAKEFYENIHKRFGSEFYRKKKRDDFSDDERYQFFDTIRRTTYEEMLLMKQKKIIVSFTTYPARISCVPTVFESITNQSIKPDKVILWLSKEQFPNEIKDLPKEVTGLDLDIRFVEDDLKPHKKYFYVFNEYPEDIVITIDDDLNYDYQAIENLYNSYLQHPDCLSTLRTHLMLITEEGKLLPYSSWPMECSILLNAPSHQLFSTNGAGTLFPPHIFDGVKDTLYDVEAIKEICLFADDLWIKACALLADVPVVLAAPCTDLSYIEGSQSEGLRYMNLDQNANDAQWAKIESYMSDKFKEDVLTKRLTADSQKGERLIGVERLSGYFVKTHRDAKDVERLRTENEWLWQQVNSKAFKLGTILAKPIRMIKELK